MSIAVVTPDTLKAIHKCFALNHSLTICWMAKTPYEQYQVDKLSALEAEIGKLQEERRKQT